MSLKLKNIFLSYILPIAGLVLMMMFSKVMFMFLFQIGRQYGTFLRNMFEFSCNLV